MGDGTTMDRPLRRAAIDIGTVTTRLLVADVSTGGRIAEIVRRTRVTHLGRGLHATGSLSPEGISAVVTTVGAFMDEVAGLGVDQVSTVATSAARDAVNGGELLSALEALGAHPRIIPGAVEARLSFLGATYDLECDRVLVADLGGGSTELVVGSSGPSEEGPRATIEAASSVDVGSRRVLDMFLHSDPPAPAELRQAREWTAAQMRPFFDSLGEDPSAAVVLAGTGTSLSAVRQHLEVYDPSLVHGSRLTLADLAGLERDLARMTSADRRHVVGLDPERADVIVAGAVILSAILHLARLSEVTVSEHDILYGMVLEGA
jgi:exopolyphosphatase/guanosine-5'-triphosphate,3'-diphosphate pyrophosphatase